MVEIVVPDDAIEERFLAATGPGGQNVNKVATAVQLRVDLFRLGLHPETYARLRQIAGSKVNGRGELLITARRYRTQDANRDDARARLAALLEQAQQRDAKRIRTKPSRAAKAKRVDAKKGRATIKSGRAKVRLD